MTVAEAHNRVPKSDVEVSAEELKDLQITVLGGDPFKEGDVFTIPVDYKVYRTKIAGSENPAYYTFVVLESGQARRLFFTFFNRFAKEVDSNGLDTGNNYRSNGQPCVDYQDCENVKDALDKVAGKKIKVEKILTIETRPTWWNKPENLKAKIPTLAYV